MIVSLIEKLDIYKKRKYTSLIEKLKFLISENTGGSVMKHFFITITFFFIIVICLIACSNEIESSNNNSPAPTYTVTYSDGVDDAEIKVPVDSSSYHTGDIVSVKFDEIGTRSGYSFLSWSNGNETFSSNGTTSFKMGTSNVSLMAQWKKNPEVKRVYLGENFE